MLNSLNRVLEQPKEVQGHQTKEENPICNEQKEEEKQEVQGHQSEEEDRMQCQEVPQAKPIHYTNEE